MAVCDALEIRDLQVGYGKRTVLHQVNVTVPQGKIVGVLGPSGSGKTTLVRSVLGVIPIESGHISVFGMPVPSLSAMAEIGYMAQSDALYDDLTATEHLLFFARLQGLSAAEAKARAKELLTFVELDAQPGQPVRNYSGGMRRRLSLAIALIAHAPLLILDEPTVGIDPVLRRKFWDAFEALKAEGRTLLTTTHVMDEAARCDRLLMVRDGRIIADGTVSEMLAQTGADTLENAFLHFSAIKEKEMA